MFAPAISGPKASIPICDWRSDPPNAPAELRGPGCECDFRNVQIVDRSSILKHVQEHDAGKPHPILRPALNLRLALLADVGGSELLVFLSLAMR